MKHYKAESSQLSRADERCYVDTTDGGKGETVSYDLVADGKNHVRLEDYEDACADSSYGRFNRLANDFASNSDELDDALRFRDRPHWTPEKREKVRKFRFVICTLALMALALSLMSRMIMNVAVVEMVKNAPVVEVMSDETVHDTTTTTTSDFTSSAQVEQLSQAPVEVPTTTITLPSNIMDPSPNSEEMEESMPTFDWSKSQVNRLLASFYAGYAPAILLSGGIADKYGSKYPLLVCVAGSSIINLLTPLIARSSYSLLISSRILLGVVQGAVMPSLYDIFNMWLTANESSIFAPMIKVSMPLGSLIGTSLPGIMASLGFEWPFLFYTASFLCLVWSLAWVPLASSTPETSKFVEPNELERIIKKKKNRNRMNLAVVSADARRLSDKVKAKELEAGASVSVRRPNGNSISGPPPRTSIPWWLIMTNPSVIALTLVKYTYNIGMDFFYLELAVYLREMHDASIEVISLIASGGYFMQMILITFVGWSAKNLVNKRAFGLSVTKWRKIFQGSSNFAMACTYFALPFAGSNLPLVATLILVIWFFWMLGAGGESMVPYDLSSKYPATIVGLSHSISMLSGLSIPPICSLILGENTDDPSRWNLLFCIVGCILTTGGLIFVSLLKAKPFLPEERNAPA